MPFIFGENKVVTKNRCHKQGRAQHHKTQEGNSREQILFYKMLDL